MLPSIDYVHTNLHTTNSRIDILLESHVTSNVRNSNHAYFSFLIPHILRLEIGEVDEERMGILLRV
jgi:hypothetical protein